MGQLPSLDPRIPSSSRWEDRQLWKADSVWAFHVVPLKATVEKSTKVWALTIPQFQKCIRLWNCFQAAGFSVQLFPGPEHQSQVLGGQSSRPDSGDCCSPIRLMTVFTGTCAYIQGCFMSIHHKASHLAARRAFRIIVGHQRTPPQNRPLDIRIVLRKSRQKRSSEKQNKSCPFVRTIYTCKGNIHLWGGLAF